MFKVKFKFKGFTLIELLVVIAVIALLVTLSILALSNARTAARDSKRVADIRQMQTALELFYDNNNRYPTNAEFQSGRLSYFDSNTGTTTFISIPTAPTPADGFCTDSNNGYAYNASADGSTYGLNFCTAKKINNLPAGALVATPGGIIAAATPVTSPQLNPRHLASLVDDSMFITPYSVYVSGNYLYAIDANLNSLVISDISNPAAPVYKGKIVDGAGDASLYNPSAVFVSGNYAYVTASGALEIIDVSDPQHPVHAGKIFDGEGSNTNFPHGAYLSSPSSVFVSGNYAYVTGSNAVEIVDVTVKTSPVHKSSIINGYTFNSKIASLYSPVSVFVSGNFAYVASQGSNALQLVDISSSTHPIPTGKVTYTDDSIMNAPRAVYVLGNFAYVACAGDGSNLDIVDISSSTKPLHKGNLLVHSGLLDSPRSIYVSGSYAYIASAANNVLEIVNISSSTHPVHTSSLADGAGGALLRWPVSVFVSAGNAYVASQNSSAIEIVDVSNPASPSHKGALTNSGRTTLYGGHSVFRSGNYAYLITDSSLEIIDVSNPANPVHKSNILNGQGGAVIYSPTSLFVSDNYAYLMNYGGNNDANNSLEIINVSDPAHPVHAGIIPNGGSNTAPYLKQAYSVFVTGNYAYVTSADSDGNSLQIINITDKQNPTVAGYIRDNGDDSVPYLSSPQSVYVSGNYAYVVSSNSNALQIINVTDPYNPIAAGYMRDGQGVAPYLSQPSYVYVVGNYAYVTSWGGSLQIINVVDPQNPVAVGNILDDSANGGASLTGPSSVRVFGNYAFVTDQNNNALEIIDISNPASPTHKATVANGANGALLTGLNSVFVSGNYAYVASNMSNALEIIDLYSSN
jgi:prepilin-type N-terminal cleavage/methylation domain-containing protein